MTKVIDELLKNEEFFTMLKPYIDDYFTKLKLGVLNGFNADKLKATSQLSDSSRDEYLDAKSNLVRRYRDGVVYMETVYTKLYKFFEKDLTVALKKKMKGQIGKATTGKLPRKSVAKQQNSQEHQQRFETTVYIVNAFADKYIDEYNIIGKRLFADE